MSKQSLRVFINYRHEDTSGEALLLYDRLANHFGADNVFLDLKHMQPGMKWLQEIKSSHASCGAMLVLIGSRWLSSMTRRAQARTAGSNEDFVIAEIEMALRKGPGIEVIPLLVGEVAVPTADRLPRSVRALADLEMGQVRHKEFEADVARLVERLEKIKPRPAGPGSEPPEADRPAHPQARKAGPPPIVLDDLDQVRPHYDQLLRYLVDEGTVVVLLGSRVNAAGRGTQWEEGCGSLPDSGELAANLAKRFNHQCMDLAEVAEYVAVTSGTSDLFRALKQLLAEEAEPNAVHRFLARFPGRLEALGLPRRCQMIVTANYDRALEQAFDEENEPYDLVVYMASGDDRGKFLYIPFDGDPEPINVPNTWGKLPIDSDTYDHEVSRTVIVKIHGAVDAIVGNYRWRENYVITEDHYIDYMSGRPVNDVIPVQILDKLQDSHCLFLGYGVRDWHSRVLLKRIWDNDSLRHRCHPSWAVEPGPDNVEKEFWHYFGVDLITTSLTGYVQGLDGAINAAPEPAHANERP